VINKKPRFGGAFILKIVFVGGTLNERRGIISYSDVSRAAFGIFEVFLFREGDAALRSGAPL